MYSVLVGQYWGGGGGGGSGGDGGGDGGGELNWAAKSRSVAPVVPALVLVPAPVEGEDRVTVITAPWDGSVLPAPVGLGAGVGEGSTQVGSVVLLRAAVVQLSVGMSQQQADLAAPLVHESKLGQLQLPAQDPAAAPGTEEGLAFSRARGADAVLPALAVLPETMGTDIAAKITTARAAAGGSSRVRPAGVPPMRRGSRGLGMDPAASGRLRGIACAGRGRIEHERVGPTGPRPNFNRASFMHEVRVLDLQGNRAVGVSAHG